MGQERHFSTEAIILKTSIINEINKQFFFISPEIGVHGAIAYGAANNKNKFCSSVSPFVKAKLFLYKNPKSIFYKLEDIADVTLNDNYTKGLKSIYLLSFFSEILLNTFISHDEYKSYYYLLLYAAELLQNNKFFVSFLFFVSKFFYLSGYNYNLSNCRKCQEEFDFYFFDSAEGGVLCFKHAKNTNFKLSKESAFLWKSFFENKFAVLKNSEVSRPLFDELFPLLLVLIKNIFERNIKTINFLKDVF